ncbi:MAG: DUF3501 family protein [Proteobacteria bacterium]|nr:DUF3501 family protein [Pseudomonadota bacterium]MDA1058083.1 DUF3501 family protein [Pseudomonadota bacterium]
MTRANHEITRADLMAMEAYAAIRKQKRSEISAIKQDRRVGVGPFATFYFENYDTMWMQIHEMLFIEKGGEAQIADELTAYNPLIPKGKELVATLMFEIEDPVRRDIELHRLTNVERTVSLRLGDETVTAVPEGDVERTKADGKTSSIHFLRFPMTTAQVEAFRDSSVAAVLQIGHDHYGHMAVVPRAARAALQGDFDAA